MQYLLKMVKCSDLQIIKQSLESLNVCQKCVMRFLGIKEYSSYTSKIRIEKAFQELMGKKNDLPNQEDLSLSTHEEAISPCPKRHLPSPCSACLGILQNLCDEMTSKILMMITESGHVFEDFVIQLSIPVVVDLRDQLFYLHLKEILGEAYPFNVKEIASVKDVWKWVIGSQMGKITKADFSPFSDFQISLSITYPDTVKECLPLFQKCPEAFPNRKKKKAKSEDIYTRTAVLKAMESLSSELKNLYSIPPCSPDKNCIFEKIHCNHTSLYLGGRYNKYSRELSQTPWVVDGERRMDSSVNEFITNVVEKRIMADKIIFSASGREDVDVKMLGNGRPFVLEIINPRRLKWTEEEMKAIEKEINDSTDLISVKNLQIISKKDTLLLKEGEEQKRKVYSALCIVEKILCQDDIDKLESLKDLALSQKTPIRVLHRRTLATRERLLHTIQAEIHSKHQLRVKLETQAGTYVKEFVHGDFGRSTPSLGTLLNTRADILELDVESIELEWPPKPS